MSSWVTLVLDFVLVATPAFGVPFAAFARALPADLVAAGDFLPALLLTAVPAFEATVLPVLDLDLLATASALLVDFFAIVNLF